MAPFVLFGSALIILAVVKPEWLASMPLLIGGTLGASLISGLVLFRQNRASQMPLLELTELAKKISKEKSYNHRFQYADRDDELGGLIRSLNSMMDQVQIRDEKLVQEFDEMQSRNENRRLILEAEYAVQDNLTSRLNMSEEKYVSLVESAGTLIWQVDLDGTFTYVNAMGCREVYGCEKNEIDGKTIQDLTHPDYLEADLALFEAARNGTPGHNHETRHIRPDGTEVDIMMSLAAFGTGRSIEGLTGMCTDISKRKIAEAQSQELSQKLARSERMESLGLLAGGVAHDLNNILGPIVGYPDLILHDLEPNHPVRDDVIELKKSALRATDVISDLLTMSRRGNYKLEPVFLEDIVKDHLTSATFKELDASNPGIECVPVFNLEARMPIEGSTSHLSQVIMNLVRNSYEAMHGRGVLSIHLEAKSFESDTKGNYESISAGDYVLLRVSDTGEGIPKEHLDKIFEPFFSSKTMGASGSGLGLSVVYGIVKDLRGTIDISTKIGEGTEFRLYFPMKPDMKVVAPEPVQTNAFHFSNSILVVEDVEEQQKLAVRILRSFGMDVVTVGSGHGALEHMKNRPFDIVMIDMVLEDEEFDGLATFRAVRKVNSRQACLLVSGFSVKDRVDTCLAEGAFGFVKKPFTIQELGSQIKHTLDSR